MRFINLSVKRSTACILLLVMLAELLCPVAAFALTSGPSQPEMQSFEPVGTTDMVNAFSGDFVYNIPLLDVEGYPVNIAYHSGITTEQEASWVGLGWNINPGNISHAVRGIPDDFNGEKIEKTIEINDELKKRFGMFFTLEIAGLGMGQAAEAIAKVLKVNMGGGINMGVNISNYTGVSASFGTNGNVSVGPSMGWMSAGINMGATFSTDGGADLDASTSISGPAKSPGTMTTAVNGSFGAGFNSREGLKYTSFGVNPSINIGRQSASVSYENTHVPISMQNFVPVITNASFAESKFFQFKLGIEASATIYPNFGGSYGEDRLSFETDGTRPAYGYFNLQHATKDDITDFTRDRDGRFNRDMQYLPSGNMTYDVYGVNGQGTAGNFRSFRNDIGTVYDPYTNSDNKSSSNLVEVGVGNIFEAGWDRANAYTSSSSGPWNTYKNSFSDKKTGSLYEPHYFKQAGELSEANDLYLTAIKGSKPLNTRDIRALTSEPLKNAGDDVVRSKRANLLYYFTAAEASDPGVSLQSKLQDYINAPGTPNAYVPQTISRTGGNHKSYHASEFTQLLPDGRRYIYGIPAMNNQQVEYVVSCEDPGTGNGIVDLRSNNLKPYGNNVAGNPDFGQKFFMKSATPAYAHSYLLSSILSPDYSDLTGDGITDDDLGTYTKFNYSRKNTNYTWRTPFETGSAQYDKGVASDCHDDKGTFIIGSKEIWMLHSIESKNYVAEFYTSPRTDAIGSSDTQALTGANGGQSYKLDSIALYNRKDRLTNGSNAVPIKKVIFTYDYSLCKGIPNTSTPGTGKLTLKAISIKYGNSDLGMLSPYRFSYDGINPDYDQSRKDMWGNYKPSNGNGALNLTNHQFPYVYQNKATADQNAGAWNLTKVRLPSGGSIQVTYEADDYSYVQDRRSMEMFKVAGIGPDKNFQTGNALYQSPTSPYLYVYFERKKDGNNTINEWYNDMRKAYLDNGELIQYNFKVSMSASGETLPSCGIPLADNIKGYAAVEDIGVCPGNSQYGYIKLSPKTVDKMPSLSKLGVSNLQLNPVTLAAIFYAKYYNNKALYPSSEILSSANGTALIQQIIASMLDLANYFRSPITKYLNDGRAKYTDLDQSYIRLCSQGNKIGGGHRVKRIEFSDSWDQVSGQSQQAAATYGSEYDYTTLDASGRRISSGVASYEPLLGGDENPFKEPIATDKIGQKRDFPVVIPTELTVEGPVGESMYPSADVGYGKVTVTSIHKTEGASSQTIQEHEFYTAKDYPVRTANTQMEVLEDKQVKAFDLSPNKTEAYRVGQGYTLTFNDMHGKPKKESVLVAQAGGDARLVSYKKYEYFENADRTLNNNVPCMYYNAASKSLQEGNKVLGIETDMMLDSREKTEESRTTGFMANLNVFMASAFPIPIPSAFPKIPKSHNKAFSSIVSTKVVQQYGILKSVETFDKGAAVKLSNELFDATTGQPIITRVNTEHNDYEYQIKYPAYWAYQGMGPAYRNILYDENISDNATIVNDTFYLKTPNYSRFNPGDELLFTLNKSCVQGQNNPGETYKLWVTDNQAPLPDLPTGFTCKCPPISSDAITYALHYHCMDLGGNTHSVAEFVNYPGFGVSNPSSPDNGKYADNICGVPRTNVFDVGVTTLAMKELLSRTSSTFPQLAAVLTGSNKYPIERFSQTSDGTNADFPASPNDPLSHPYKCIDAGCNQKIFLNGLSAPFAHYGWPSGANTTFTGVVGSTSAYANDYQGWPLLFSTPNVIKLTVKLNQRVRAYAYNDTNPNSRYSDTVKMFDIADPSLPHDIETNNYYETIYTLYFPYDPVQGPSLSSLQQALNRQNVNYIDIVGPYITYWQKKDPVNPSQMVACPSPAYPVTINGNSYAHHIERQLWYYTTKAEIVPRTSQGTGYTAVAALPQKRNAPSGVTPAKTFPHNDRIYQGSVKVIRSGKRNQLQDNVETVSALQKNLTGPNHNKVIAIGAQTFTDEAATSGTIADIGTDYYNPYVTGRKGNYRILAKYGLNGKRDYTAATDPEKGIMNLVKNFWAWNGTLDQPMTQGTGVNTAGWYLQSQVNLYSPWGNDLEVQDAAGNIQSVLYGYGNKFPVAVVKNGRWNDALFENFEDYDEPANVLNFYQNNLNQYLKQAVANNTVSLSTGNHHTGTRALSIQSAIATNIPIASSPPASFPAGALYPFYFRKGKKYVMSYWQKVDQNTTPPATGSISLHPLLGSPFLFAPKTPVIDGWVLYEQEIAIPALSSGTTNMQFAAPNIVDDIRIIPQEANMKSYVYHPVTHKLVAILDENHMASFFEYDAEGKLVRIKKETEKGILTLKESRSSLHNILNAATGTVDLRN